MQGSLIQKQLEIYGSICNTFSFLSCFREYRKHCHQKNSEGATDTAKLNGGLRQICDDYISIIADKSFHKLTDPVNVQNWTPVNCICDLHHNMLFGMVLSSKVMGSPET